MALAWKATNRRALTPWVLIVISLLSGGCRSLTERNFQRLVNPRVCPTCTATFIEQCQCFSPTENAGYSEPTWSSLDSTMTSQPYAPTHSEEMEELPAPVIWPAPSVEDERSSGNDSSPAAEVVQTPTNWDFEAQTDGRRRGLAVASSYADEDEAHYDYSRP